MTKYSFDENEGFKKGKEVWFEMRGPKVAEAAIVSPVRTRFRQRFLAASVARFMAPRASPGPRGESLRRSQGGALAGA